MMGRRSHSFSGTSSAATASQNPNRAMHAIGFAVYEVPPNVTRLTAHFVAEHVNYIIKIFTKRSRRNLHKNRKHPTVKMVFIII